MSEKDGSEAQAFLEEVLDTLDEIFFVFTPEGKMVQWNRRVPEVTGYADEEIAQMHPVEFVPDGEVDLIRRKIGEVLHEGRVRLEAHFLTKAGERIPYEFTGRLLEREDEVLICGTGRDITERKRFQDQFRLLVEEVEDYAIFMLDPEGRVITWNEGAEKIKGYGRDEILGEHFSMFYTEKDRKVGSPQQAMETAIAEGHVEHKGWRVRRDGSRFWARATLTALHDEKGCLRGFAKVTRDLTEEREREQALRESEKRYRRLFEESQEGIGISTPKGEIIDVNSAALEIFGYTAEEFKEIPLQEHYVDPEERQKAIELMRRQGIVRDLEVRLRRKDGEVIVCQLSSTARRGPGGEIEAFQTFFRDITAQKRVQEALEESEEKFRTVAEKALVGIGLVQEGVMQYVNPRYAEIFGYDEEELIDRSPEVFIHPDDRDYVQRQMERRLSGMTDSVRYQFKGLTKDGEVRYLDVYGGRITYRGEPAVIATVMDITRQRRLEEQLLEIQEAERRRIGQELHDGIASQLTGVTMIGETLTNALEAGEEVPPSDLEELTELVRETAQQTRLLSRGLNPVQVGKEGLPAALDQLAERTEKQSGLSCRFEVEGDVPELDEQRAAHLYRIAQEAVNNAAKHAEASCIEVHLSAANETVKLSVVDDGKGLPQEDREKGEGLGLHTMRYRADLIGGRLEISSGPDGGTIVRCQVSRE